MKKESKLVHSSHQDDYGAVAPPLYRNVGYAYDKAEKLSAVFSGQEAGYLYSRLGNPTVTLLEQRLAALENGLGAVAFASGMAAISNVILTLAGSGDELIASSSIYAGTLSLFSKTLSRLGIKIKWFEPGQEETVANLITDKTKLIFCETIGNPKMDVVDIKKISTAKGTVPLVVDATLTPPVMFQAKAYGADIIIHSTTKYISGQGRAIGGVAIDSGLKNWKKNPEPDWSEAIQKRGRLSFLTALRCQYLPDLGACMAPEIAEMTLLGLETLGVRMERVLNNTEKVADFLSQEKHVKAVHYPGLANDPFYKIAKAQFDNRFGAFLTIDLETQEKAFLFVDQLKMCHNLPNIGDVRTLVIHPWSSQGIQHSEEERRKSGMTPGLVRLSIGIEDSADIIEDIKQALQKSEEKK